jgi:lipoyl(octanoyl) transferase
MTTIHEVAAALATPVPEMVVRRLQMQPYAPTRAAMIAFTAERDATTPDEVWLVEHPPVYTFGQAGRPEHLHDAGGIPVERTERGGQVTYHGPGQLVAYPLVDLRRRGIKVREFVRLIEDGIIDVLATYNLAGRLKPGAPGVYVAVDDATGDELQKVAALGLKIVNGCSFHGLSINVAMDLGPWSGIDACGYPGLKTVDLATLGVQASVDAVGDVFTNHFTARLRALTPH